MKTTFLLFAAAMLAACSSSPSYEKPDSFQVTKVPYSAPRGDTANLPKSLSAAEFQDFYKELGEVTSKGSESILQMHAQALSDYAKKMQRRAEFWQRYIPAIAPTQIWDLGTARQKLGEEGYNKKFEVEMKALQANLDANKPFADYAETERNYLASELHFGISAIFLKMADLARQSLQQRIY